MNDRATACRLLRQLREQRGWSWQSTTCIEETPSQAFDAAYWLSREERIIRPALDDDQQVAGSPISFARRHSRSSRSSSVIRAVFVLVVPVQILITISRFAPACYKFADGKPMDLIDDSNLLALIEEYTDMKVRIMIPPRKS